MITEDGECLACDNTGLVTLEERRGLDLHDTVVACPACRPDDFANDGEERVDYGDRADRDPDPFGAYPERLRTVFGDAFVDELEAA